MCVATAAELDPQYIYETESVFEACQAALQSHREAVQQGASLAEVLTVLGVSIMRRDPSPRLNVIAAMMAIDEVVFLNACQWQDLDIAVQLEIRLTAAAAENLRLTELATWLDSLITC
jgi:hypothetical protein